MKYFYIFLFVVFVLWLWPQKRLKIKTYPLLAEKGEVFLVISDMHNNALLPFSSFARKIKKENPTAILLLGDLIDRRGGYRYTKRFLAILGALSLPIYFVRGNHEPDSPHGDELWEDLLAMGAICLENTSINQGNYRLGGIACFSQAREAADIYLCHNPMDALKGPYAGLYLAGHTHGGMVRFPFFGAFYVPNQKTFPAYQKGYYKLEDRELLITSGIGNTFLPLRFSNPIEVLILK